MPYGTFSRFADYTPPDTDVVRLPDGSLIMTGNRQVQRPGMLDRLRAAASQIIPVGMSARAGEPAAPWWIAQPTNAPVAEAAPQPVASNPLGKVDPWAAIEREAAREQAINDQLGDFSRRVMASPELIEGKWFAPRK